MTQMVIPGVTDTHEFSQVPLGSTTVSGDGPLPPPEATATLSPVVPLLCSTQSPCSPGPFPSPSFLPSVSRDLGVSG